MADRLVLFAALTTQPWLPAVMGTPSASKTALACSSVEIARWHCLLTVIRTNGWWRASMFYTAVQTGCR
jgi:hypothetical protein